MAQGSVFVVSDDVAIRDSLAELLASTQRRVEAFASFDAWLAAVPPAREGCLVLDGRPREFAEPERHARFASVCAGRPVLLLVDRGDVPVAIGAIKSGAAEVLEKPLRHDSVLDGIDRAEAARPPAVAGAHGLRT